VSSDGTQSGTSVVPAAVAFAFGISLLATDMIGSRAGLGWSWLFCIALLHLELAGWLIVRPAPKGRPWVVSAGMVATLTLLAYGAWAPMFAARNGSPVVVGILDQNALAYPTIAATVVATGMVAVDLFRRLRPRHDRKVRKRARTASLWRTAWILEALALACYLLYQFKSGRSPIGLGVLGKPTDSGFGVGSVDQFLLAAIDVSIAAAIVAVGVARGRRQRALTAAMVALNLFLYATIGFKYRLVALIGGVVVVWVSGKPSRGSTRHRRAAQLVAGAVVITGVFIVEQVFRNNLSSGLQTTAQSFSLARVAGIPLRQLDISSPYSAVHQAHFSLLGGRSYLQLPSLFVPRVLFSAKPAPAMVLQVHKVTVPGAGAAVPLWAEADANFGLFGLVGFGLLLGYMTGMMDNLDSGRTGGRLICAACLSILFAVLSRSLMFFAVLEIVAVVLPVVVALRLASIDEPDRSRGAAHARLPQGRVLDG